VEALPALAKDKLPETTSHRTNRCPSVGVAVKVIVAPDAPAPVFGTAVPIEALLEMTVTALPAAKTARTDTAPPGMANEAAGVNLPAMLAFEKPLGAVPVTSQWASA